MKKIKYLISVWCFVILTSCSDYLDVKSDFSIVMPSKISDYQAMLDRSALLMNAHSPYCLIMVGAEEFEIESSIWHSFPTTSNRYQQKFGYIWADEIYNGDISVDWNKGYERILNLNIILDGLKRIPTELKESLEWKNVYGSALFLRSWTYYALAQAFCEVYDLSNVNKPGLPLRLEGDVTLKSTRATIDQTYTQILDDMLLAIEYLPEKSDIKTRPSKAAGFGFLARAYLQMGDYANALINADNALKINSNLINFADLNIEDDFAFPYDDFGRSNEEVIYFEMSIGIPLMNKSYMHVSADLLSLYEPGDLRYDVFFKEANNGKAYFKGSYTGALGHPFTGIYTGELLLIRAECLARKGDSVGAIASLNTLLQYRISSSNYIPVQDLSGKELLDYIFKERRKELCFKGARWNDLRRLNKDTRFAVTIRRIIDDQVYELAPNSTKYVWPIPDEVIKRTGMPQNVR